MENEVPNLALFEQLVAEAKDGDFLTLSVAPLPKRSITVVGRELDGRPLREIIEENERGEFLLPRAMIIEQVEVGDAF